MESISLRFSHEAFDAMVHHKDALPEGADLAIAIKENATVSGKPGAVIAFTVTLPNGKKAMAQAVTTVAALKAALSAISGRYPD